MNRRKRCPALGQKVINAGGPWNNAGRTANNAGRKAALREEARSPGAIESGGHQVVGFVALRQNKPAQSGRLGGGQGCTLPSPAPLCAARAVAAAKPKHLKWLERRWRATRWRVQRPDVYSARNLAAVDFRGRRQLFLGAGARCRKRQRKTESAGARLAQARRGNRRRLARDPAAR